MRYTTYINNKQCLEWGITVKQGALLDWIMHLPEWGQRIVVDKIEYYFMHRPTVIKDLPLFFKCRDTLYRHLKVLQEKGLITTARFAKKDFVHLTEKANAWNVIPNGVENITEIGKKIRCVFGKKSDLFIYR